MTFRGILAAATVLLMLTSCGGGDPAAAEVDRADAADAADAAGTADSATLRQYASLIARHHRVAAEAEAIGDCNWRGAGRLGEPGDVSCGFGVLTTGRQAGALGDDLEYAQSPSRREYIGPPPAEVAPLVDATRAAARELGRLQEAWHPRCTFKTRGVCSDDRLAMQSAVGDMASVFNAWIPYLRPTLTGRAWCSSYQPGRFGCPAPADQRTQPVQVPALSLR
jgi:hypothetical protein